MAVISNAAVIAQSQDGTYRWAVLAIRKVTAADTIDVSSVPSALFTTVNAALFVATTNRTATTALATVAGTVITVNGTGIANDGGLLFVVGEYA